MVFYYKLLYNKSIRIARKNVVEMRNKKGFVLVETLVVAVAVMGIFSLLYANYYPLIGEYEKREVYDEVDAKYAAHWVRKILIEKTTNNNAFTMNSCGGNCHILYAAYYRDVTSGDQVRREKTRITDETDSIFGDNAPFMQNFITAGNIRAVIITRYNITNFKNYVKNTTTIGSTNINNYIFNRGFREYIDYLPKYKTASINGAGYRVFVIVDHNTSKEYDTYGTIEVKA